MTIEEIQFTHQAFIQWLKQVTYPSVAVLAIERGKLEGSWEILIGAVLKKRCSTQCEAAFKTMEELGFETFTDETFELAGQMILENEKIVIN